MVGLAQGLDSKLSCDDDPFTFLIFPLPFLRFLGEGALVLSTECDLRRLVLPDLASRFTVHQLLFPDVSFCTFTNRLCRDRLCLTEFCTKRGDDAY